MNVDKRSRKNRSVNSGKGLDLMVGPRGFCTNVATARGDCDESCGPSGRSFGGAKEESFGALYLAQ